MVYVSGYFSPLPHTTAYVLMSSFRGVLGMVMSGTVPIHKLSLLFTGKQTCRFPALTSKTLATWEHCRVRKKHYGVPKEETTDQSIEICTDGVVKKQDFQRRDTGFGS